MFFNGDPSQLLVSVFLFESVDACAGGCSFMPSLKLRMPSARPLPSSGSFFGPNNSRAIAATSSQCHGENSPIKTSDSLSDQCQNIGYGRPVGKSNEYTIPSDAV